MAKPSPKTGGDNRTLIPPNAAPASDVDTATLNMSKNKDNNAARGTAHTTAPVESSPANQSEFVDAVGLQTRFGIKRSLAYALLADGAIRGVSLRRRGHTRGKRLFAVDSVRAFLRSQMEAK
jgi:hypothetical protein